MYIISKLPVFSPVIPQPGATSINEQTKSKNEKNLNKENLVFFIIPTLFPTLFHKFTSNPTLLLLFGVGTFNKHKCIIDLRYYIYIQ